MPAGHRLVTGLAFALGLSCPGAGAERAEIVIADFEGETYGDWKAAGEAFGRGPARGTLPNQQEVSGFLGRGLANSFLGGDDATGRLVSPEFTIARQRINFLIGGGNHPRRTCIDLLAGGKVVRTATGPNNELLRWLSWDVSDLEGQAAQLEILDEAKGGWGHINIDHILQTDRPPAVADDRDGALARARRSIEEAASRAARDPSRPLYHFRPPGNWNNDPNGPLFHEGWYHLFYQLNPYGDAWGHMHWGHARSRDLVRWEHLPVALWPSRALGEEHCFSGCAARNAKGEPMLFYTSIGHAEPECWIALPEDDDLRVWRKHPANPVLRESSADVKLHSWRDPFFFRHEGRAYLVHGGNLNAEKGGGAAVSLHRAENDELTAWKYLGILFEHPDPEVKNIECPNFFQLGGKWVLITSPHRACDWFTGTFDTGSWKFRPEARGLADHSENYDAPNGLEDPRGRRLLWGWVRGFKEGRGWNGCMTLPRVLSIGGDGRLVQRPAPELEALRGQRRQVAGLRLEDGSRVLDGVRGSLLEIAAAIDPGRARQVGLKLRRSDDGSRSIAIAFDGKAVEVAGTRVPLALPPADRTLRLHLFLDRSVLEVYLDGGRECVTRVVYPPDDDLGVELFAAGGDAVFTIEAWDLKPIW